MKRRPRVFSAKIALACLVLAVVLAVGSVPVLAWRAQVFIHQHGYQTIELFRLDRSPHSPVVLARQDVLGYVRWAHSPPGPPIAQLPPETDVLVDPRPAWAQPRARPWPEGHEALSVGLPFPSALGWYEIPSDSRPLWAPVWKSSPPSRMLHIDRHLYWISLPFVPRWPGLLANTLIFFLIPFAPWTLLRWRRLSRIERLGLCYRCQYQFPREIMTCPECGTSRPSGRKGTP